MWKRKIEFAKWQTPAQRAHTVRWTQREDARKAALCNTLMFWRRCRVRVCRRNHTCSHDPQACFDRHWAQIPETDKTWFRGLLTGLKDGLPPQEAIRRADAEAAHVTEKEAAAQRALDSSSTPAGVPRTAPHTPRVRGL